MKELFRKETLEKDALNRIKWDRSLNPSEFSILYIDLGRLREVDFSDMELQGDFFKVEESLIPMHRIRKIKWKENVVWEKRRV